MASSTDVDIAFSTKWHIKGSAHEHTLKQMIERKCQIKEHFIEVEICEEKEYTCVNVPPEYVGQMSPVRTVVREGTGINRRNSHLNGF